MQSKALNRISQMPPARRYKIAAGFSVGFHVLLLLAIGLWAGLGAPRQLEAIPIELVFGAQAQPQDLLGGEPEAVVARPTEKPAATPQEEAPRKPAAQTEAPKPAPAAAKVLTAKTGEDTAPATAQTGEAAAEGGGEETVSGPTQGPGVVGGPLPVYPKNAMDLGLEGEVVLLVRVGAGGEMEGVSIQKSSGHELLDEAALRAVRRGWSFEPGLKNGQPAQGEVTITFVFRNNAVKRG